VKTHCGLDLEAFLTHLNDAAGAGWTRAVETDLVGAHLLTWDQVRAIQKAGMDIGSHTRTHRVLQTIASAELESELALSRSQLEAELGTTVRAISYPVGRSIAGSPDVRAAVERAGYRIGFNYEPSPQSLRDFDPLDIHRFSVARTTSDLALTSQLAFRWFLR
jgi:peptidoglycan/xylan/chitin deacetylase (PgdA/CDA1 family)